MNRYERLLSPIVIGGNILKNRMIYPNASPHVLQGPETYPAESYRAFYANVAKNGAAVITLAEWDDPTQRIGPADVDITHMQSFDLSDPSTHNYFSQMAEEVHFYDSKLLIEPKIAMPDGFSLNGGYVRRATGGGAETAPLPVGMMPEVIDAFVKKLRMYRNIGYDGMAMRVDGYMTPDEHRRGDEYGAEGGVEDRTRFVRRVFKGVKEALGGDFIIEVIIAGEMPLGYNGNSNKGYTLDETIEFARLVEHEGTVDILQIREKDAPKSHASGFNFKKGRHDNIAYCEAIKAAGVGIPLAPVGGYQDPEELEKYLAEGKCDMFSMARAFMADYGYGEKLYGGRGEDVRPCLWCNKCHGVILPEPDPWLTVCSVNPEHGLSHKLHRLVGSPASLKKIAVIGGGPAGMQAAVTAAERGHSVTLYEKTGRLGGQLLHSELYSFKWPIRDYKDWLIRQLGQLGVEVVLGTEPTPEMISATGADAVIAATGASPVRPGIPGAESCPTCEDVYTGRFRPGKRVVIVGGSETGVETAMHLAETGHDVTVLTRQKELAHDASKLHYITMAWVKELPNGYGRESPAWEMYGNLLGITVVTTKSISEGSVVYEDKNGVEHTLECDSVVICGGVRPNRGEAMAYSASAPRFFAVGDCSKVGNIQNCTRDAYSRACML